MGYINNKRKTLALLTAVATLAGGLTAGTAYAGGGGGNRPGTGGSGALQLFSQFAIIGGGLWAVWGVITLAGGLKDQNGPATQSGVWQVVGGGLIIAAAALFSNIAL